MFDKYFQLIYDFVKNKKHLVLGTAILLTLSSCIGFFFNDFSGSVALMLPDDINIKRNIDFFRDSNLSNKIVFSLGLNSKDKNRQDLFRAADKLTALLTPPLFTETVTGISGIDIMEEIDFSGYIPQVITEEELSLIDGRITPENVSKRLRGIYRQLLKPESIFMTSMIYSDPLGLRLLMLDKLNSLSALMEFDVNIEDGRFVSADGRHTMVITQTPVRVTDGSDSKKLLAALKEKISLLPDFVTVDIISGHLHTVSNEKVIKQDIHLAVVIAAAGFLLLFFIVFRDIRAVYIFLVPSAAVIVSISLSSMFITDLSLWVIGLSTIVAGIAVDYGIHIYVAVRNNGREARVINQIAKPICMGAFTTLGIFAAFFFSHTRGYQQMAIISVLSIFLSLIFALFILPHLLPASSFSFMVRSKTTSLSESKKKGFLNLHKLIAVLWAFSICAAFYLSFNISFESDIKNLDGSGPDVIQAEENFLDVWGRGGDKAFFVVSAGDYEEALEINDKVYNEAVQAVGPGNFLSLSAIRPSRKTRSENVNRWKEFWKEGRAEKLRRLIKEHGPKYQFSESAFSEFFNNLYSDIPVDNDNTPLIFKKHFVHEKEDRFQILSFFPDEKKYIDVLTELSMHYPGTFLVSRKILSEHMSRSIYSEGKYLTIIAATFIILMTFLFLKNFRRTLPALIPVLTSVFWLLGYLSMAGIPLNVTNLFAGIVVMGLCIDYGIFMTYNYQHNLRKSTIIAISISAVTTLIGAGVLLFAEHPALFSSGTTLFIGVLAGYISAVFVIPSVEKILPSPEYGEQCDY